MSGRESLLPLLDREVYGNSRMGYRFRARIEHRVKRGKTQWRFVGEYHHVRWSDSGPGLDWPSRSRWSSNRDKVVTWANRWLDSKELKPESVEGYA